VRIDILFQEDSDWQDGLTWGSDSHWMLRCRGCDTIFFGHAYTFSENTHEIFNQEAAQWSVEPIVEKVFYPRAIKRHKPEWFDWEFSFDYSELYSLLGEIYAALDNELLSITAMGVRAAFDLLAAQLEVEPSLPFIEKIEKLRKDQHITGREKKFLEVLTDAGGAASHRGWRPTNSEITTLMEILEGSIHRCLVLPAKVSKLEKSIPQRVPAKS
jgi:hypothetical protein